MQVSVIIPAYNASRTLAAAVRSVESQSVLEIEIIIVNDQSTDDTQIVAEALALASTLPVRVLQQPNQGQGAARNRGASVATGKWLAFLDADDIWLEGSLANRLESVQSNNASLVYGLFKRINEDGGVLPPPELRHFVFGLVSGQFIANRIFLGNIIGTSGVLVLQKVFSTAGGFNDAQALRGTEDFDLWLRIALCGGSFYGANIPVFAYRDTTGSTSKAVVRMARGEQLVLHKFRHHITLPNSMVQRRLAMADLTWIAANCASEGLDTARACFRDLPSDTRQQLRSHGMKLALNLGYFAVRCYWKLLQWYALRFPDDVGSLMDGKV